MANYRDLISQSAPAAFWPLDSTSTVESDFSLSGLDASVVVNDRGMIPVVSGNSRAYTFRSQFDVVKYPSINIWSAGETGKSFSIEFVLTQTKNNSEVIIIEPITSAGAVKDNNISIFNNRLSFMISDATEFLNATQSYEVSTYLDFPGGTYYCVAIYGGGEISLFVNGELVDTRSIDKDFEWKHFSDGSYAMQTRGESGSEVSVSSMAMYKRKIERPEMIRKYGAMLRREPPENIAAANSGRLFKLNDSDSQKFFTYKNPDRNTGWEDVVLDNLSVVNNRLSLDEIEPIELNSGTESYAGGYIDLSTTQFLRVNRVNRFFSGTEGSLGVHVETTSSRHGTTFSGEYIILSISNSNRTCRITVLEKPDNKIYIRYVSNGVQIADTELGNVTLGTNTVNYLYLSFSSEAITARWNYDSVEATVSIGGETGAQQPMFGEDSYLILGADSSGLNCWGGRFSWLNLFDTGISSETNLVNIKELVYQYTAKLESNLNISQSGTATWVIDTGTDGDGTVSQSRVWWTPSIPSDKLKVETGTVNGIVVDVPDLAIDPNLISDSYYESYIDDYGVFVSNLAEVDNMVPISGATAGEDIPPEVHIRVTLSTDDSFNDIVYLKQVGVDLIENSSVLSATGRDEIRFNQRPQIYFSTENIGVQEKFSGAKIASPLSAGYLYSLNSSDPKSVNELPDISDSNLPSSEVSTFKTLEFWFNPDPQSIGSIFYYSGSNLHYCDYDAVSRRFTVSGFNKLYVDGQEVTLVNGVSDPFDTYFNSKWHILVLVKTDLVFQDDSTVFPNISGSPVTQTDISKYFFGLKSFKVKSTGNNDYVELYGSTSGLNASAGQANIMSFYVYGDEGVTEVRTNVVLNGSSNIITHAIDEERWNYIQVVAFNPGNLTSASFRVGPAASGQTIWIDGASLCNGTDAGIRLSQEGETPNSWIGYNPNNIGNSQDITIQNVTLYGQQLTATQIVNNYNSYVGNEYVTLSEGENRLPATDLLSEDNPNPSSINDPETIVNRNEEDPTTLFESNPVYLPASWQILSAN